MERSECKVLVNEKEFGDRGLSKIHIWPRSGLLTAHSVGAKNGTLEQEIGKENIE